MAPIHPEIAYAERSSATEPEKNIIYFTINAPDINGEPKLDIKPTEISFSAKAGDAAKGVPEKEYAFDLQLYSEIIPEETKKVVTSRAIVLILRKKTPQAEYWLRLTKEKPNRNWIKTDFAKWVDEDEQEPTEDLTQGMQGMQDPRAQMGGMGGPGGMDMASMFGGGGAGGPGGMDMASMFGGGGAGGPGGMDFSKMMEQMGGMGALGGAGGDAPMDFAEESDDDEEGEGAAEGSASKPKVDNLDDVE
ncbi:hypothetical protein IAT38_002436 [Cryptococcus sp. DSM 104549]